MELLVRLLLLVGAAVGLAVVIRSGVLTGIALVARHVTWRRADAPLRMSAVMRRLESAAVPLPRT